MAAVPNVGEEEIGVSLSQSILDDPVLDEGFIGVHACAYGPQQLTRHPLSGEFIGCRQLADRVDPRVGSLPPWLRLHV